MTTYFETSAIVKLLIADDGSDRADALWDAADFLVTSELSFVEARAALAAANRGGRLAATSFQHAKGALEERFRDLHRVQVTEAIVRNAGDLAEEHALRGYDAVHLSSALALETAELVLVTWDDDLAKAGRDVGFAVAGTVSA